MISIFLRQLLSFVIGISLLYFGIYGYCNGWLIPLCILPTTLGLALCVHYPLEILCHWRHRYLCQQLIEEGNYKIVVQNPFINTWLVPMISWGIMVGCLFDEFSYSYYRLHYVVFYISFIPAQLYIVMQVLHSYTFIIHRSDSFTVFGLWQKEETYDYKDITGWSIQRKYKGEIRMYYESKKQLVKIGSTMPQYEKLKTMLENDFRALREYNLSAKSRFGALFEVLVLLYPIITFLITHLIIAVSEIVHYYHLPENSLTLIPHQKIDSIGRYYTKINLAQHPGICFDAKVIHRLRLKNTPVSTGEIVDVYILASDYSNIQRVEHASTFWERHLPGVVKEVEICALQHGGKTVFSVQDYQHSIQIKWMFFWSFVVSGILLLMFWFLFWL